MARHRQILTPPPMAVSQLLELYRQNWILVLSVIGTLGLAVRLRLAVKRADGGLPFPPGPKQYPIIGSLLDMPTKKEYVTFSQWKGVYGSSFIQSCDREFDDIIGPIGEIVGLKVLGMNLLVLNSAEVVEDLLDKRGAKYSSRPPMTVLTKWWAIVLYRTHREVIIFILQGWIRLGTPNAQIRRGDAHAKKDA